MREQEEKREIANRERGRKREREREVKVKSSEAEETTSRGEKGPTKGTQAHSFRTPPPS